MNYGLYLSASGVLTNLYRQDVFANNLANIETPGFKPDAPAIRQRDPESIEDNLGLGVSQDLLDRLGGGVLAVPPAIRFQPGPLTRSGNPLDVALDTKDTFFVVRHTDERTGEVSIRFTRDGRFTRNSDGELVTQAGFRVLDDTDNPIVIPDGVMAQIDAAGRVVTADGALLGQIQVTRVADTDRLYKQGQNLFAYKGNQDPREAVDTPLVHPGHVEASGVDPIRTLMSITDASKAATTNADMIRFFDRMMDRAVNTFASVA